MRRFVSNTAYLFAGQAVRLLVGFSVGIYVARYLGPASYGVLAYVLSFVGLFGGVATLGFETLVVRDLAAGAARRDEILGSAFALRMAAGVVTFAGIIAASLVAHDAATFVMVAVLAAGTLIQPLGVIDLHFQSKVLSKYVVLSQTAGLLAASGARLALIAAGASLLPFAVVQLAEQALSLLLLLAIYVRKEGSPLAWRFDRAIAARLVADGWPLTLTAVLTAVYVNLDQVLVAWLLGATSVGNYAVALRLSTAFYFIPIAIGQSLFPGLVALRKASLEMYHVRLQLLHDGFLWLGIGIALPIAVAAPQIIRLLFGTRYAEAAPALAIHVWCTVVVFLGIVASYWLVTENLQRLYPLRIAASLVVSVGLNLLLIPVWGIRGAALAALVAQLFSSTVFYLLTPDTRLMPLMQLRSVAAPIRLIADRWKTARSL